MRPNTQNENRQDQGTIAGNPSDDNEPTVPLIPDSTIETIVDSPETRERTIPPEENIRRSERIRTKPVRYADYWTVRDFYVLDKISRK
jgi:hypothetical protein